MSSDGTQLMFGSHARLTPSTISALQKKADDDNNILKLCANLDSRIGSIADQILLLPSSEYTQLVYQLDHWHVQRISESAYQTQLAVIERMQANLGTEEYSLVGIERLASRAHNLGRLSSAPTKRWYKQVEIKLRAIHHLAITLLASSVAHHPIPLIAEYQSEFRAQTWGAVCASPQLRAQKLSGDSDKSGTYLWQPPRWLSSFVDWEILVGK